MSFGDALGKELLKAGAVVLAHRFKFPDETTAKFCVLLEDYDGGSDVTIVALTATNMRFKGSPWTVELEAGEGGLWYEGLLDCNNWHELVTNELLEPDKFKYIGQFDEDVMDSIYDALEHAYKIPQEHLMRIFGESDP